jgi:hypothetical protein
MTSLAYDSCTTALPRGANDQVGQIVAESRWRLAVFAAAWWLRPPDALRGRGIQEFVEFDVDIAIRVGVVMRPYEQDARPVWRLERNNSPELPA